MKTLGKFILTILCLYCLVLIGSLSWAQCTEQAPCPELARLSPAIVGGGVPVAAGCTYAASVVLDDNGWGNSDDGNNNCSDIQYQAQKVSIAAGETVTHYTIRGYEDMAAGKTTTVELWSDDGGSPSKPSAVVDGTSKTIDQSLLPASNGDTEFILDAPKTGLSGSYWIVVRASAAQYRIVRDTSSITVAGYVVYASSSWGTVYTDRSVRVKLHGCTP